MQQNYSAIRYTSFKSFMWIQFKHVLSDSACSLVDSLMDDRADKWLKCV